MRRFSQRSHLVTLNDINITPLLDLAFVLLIIFVITTPLLEKSIDLKLPGGGQTEKKLEKRDIATVEITNTGVFALDKKRMPLPHMIAQLTASFKANPNLVVNIRADKDSRYDLVAQVIDALPTKRHHTLFVSHRSVTQMNRLQKKCIIATTGFHLLLLVILFVGPAFFWTREKPDDSTVLEMISPNLIDAATTGVQAAQPPPPAPAVVTPPPQPQPQPQPTPLPPTPAPPVVKPPDPVPTPEKEEPVVKPAKPVKDTVKPPKLELTPVDKTPSDKPNVTKPQPPKLNLVPTTRTLVPKNNSTPNKTATTPDNSKAVNSTLTALRRNLSPVTEIAPVGNSSKAYANYGATVVSVYHHAWVPPDHMASDNVMIKFKVTVARDGTVISTRIVESSGDKSVDEAVQRMLERVTFIAPFPEGTNDSERNYPINFNATRTSE